MLFGVNSDEETLAFLFFFEQTVKSSCWGFAGVTICSCCYGHNDFVDVISEEPLWV